MKCLIIAAGQGCRLQLRGDCKPLIQVFGVPIIERVIRIAHDAGATEFVVVTGYRANLLEPFLIDLANQMDLSIRPVRNPDWRRENGISVLAAKEFLEEPFLLLMADHIFDPKAARDLIAHPPPEGKITLVVDRDLQNPNVNLSAVTFVRTDDGKIADIGKDLTAYNAFDTGVFACTEAIFGALDESCRLHSDSSLSGGVRVLAERGRANAADFSGRFWVDVDDPTAIRRAEDALLDRIDSKS